MEERKRSPSVSSQVDEVEEMSQEAVPPPLGKPTFVEDLRRITIYSEDGQESITLASYTHSDGSKRFMLNNIDIPLTDFRGYLRSLTETEDNRADELLVAGMHASFMTGLIVLLVAFGLTLIKIDSWV